MIFKTNFTINILIQALKCTKKEETNKKAQLVKNTCSPYMYTEVFMKFEKSLLV